VQRIPVTAKDDPVAAMLLSLDQGIKGNPKALRDMLDELSDKYTTEFPNADSKEIRDYLAQLKGSVLKDRYQRIEETLREVQQYAERDVTGKLTPEDAVKLKTFALARVKQVMPDYMRATLQEAVGGLDKYISSKIEQKVLEQKPMEKRPCA
jgi:CO dehydrogenase/acetyl-CoA synthase beta subunit